jgi:hypothetical protein
MPARKTTAKTATKTSAKPAKLNVPIVALYAVPIYNAIKRGDMAEMKKLSTQARKHVADVTSALASLDKAIGSKK